MNVGERCVCVIVTARERGSYWVNGRREYDYPSNSKGITLRGPRCQYSTSDNQHGGMKMSQYYCNSQSFPGYICEGIC